MPAISETIRNFLESSVDLIAGRWTAGYPDADGFVATLLHSEGGYLRDFYSTPAIDRLIEAGRREIDPARTSCDLLRD